MAVTQSASMFQLCYLNYFQSFLLFNVGSSKFYRMFTSSTAHSDDKFFEGQVETY